MNIIEMKNSASFPGALYYQPPCISSMPFCAEIVDSWSRTGSGIGNESSAVITALGEYFERRHFYTEIFAETQQTLGFSLQKCEVDEFIFALSQTREQSTASSELTEHTFGMTKVTRLSDLSACYIPSVLISIGFNSHENDNSIYPSRDTCGCSFHGSADASIFGAMKESFERQFLTRFWLTKKCNRILKRDEIVGELMNSSTLSLYEALERSGRIEAIDISDYRFPGTCLLVVYGSSDARRKVKYCAGMAYSESLASCLGKAIEELWQTYRFMNLHFHLEISEKSIKDPYLRHFLNCNSYQTYETIMDVHLTKSKTANKKDFNTETLLSTIAELNIEGYIYTKTFAISQNLFTLCKFTSPSLYLHMDNSKNINHHNKYSAEFIDCVHSERKCVMVPFP